METSIIDPAKVPALVAGGMGAFLSILFQRNASKLTIFTTLATAEIVDYYCAEPIWSVLHAEFTWADSGMRGPVALTIGLLAVFIVGAVTKMASEFAAAPWKTAAQFFVSIIERFVPTKKGE